MPANPSNKWNALMLTGIAVVLSLMTWFSATAVLPELTAHLAMRCLMRHPKSLLMAGGLR